MKKILLWLAIPFLVLYACSAEKDVSELDNDYSPAGSPSVGSAGMAVVSGGEGSAGSAGGSTFLHPNAVDRTPTGIVDAGSSDNEKVIYVGVTGDPNIDEDECSGVSKEAETQLLPSDIIWAIDTSGTMSASFPAIKDALNRFVEKMDAAAIDAHIILISAAGAIAPYGGVGFCMPAPLGSGECGNSPTPNGSALDSNEPRFIHIDAALGMSQAIPFILDNFQNYKHLLRPNARTQFVVTEDFTPLLTVDQVKNHIEGRAPATLTPAWDPPLKEGTWQFNGVVCAKGQGIGPCILAMVPPQTTLDLISSTGGLLGDLQTADTPGADPFGELLDKLAEAVIIGAKVSCEYEIPPPPDGMELDPQKVNVEYVNGAQNVTVIPQLPEGKTCEDNVSWHYDNPTTPTKVILCPAACDMVQNDPQARVDVKFGCMTVVLLI